MQADTPTADKADVLRTLLEVVMCGTLSVATVSTKLLPSPLRFFGPFGGSGPEGDLLLSLAADVLCAAGRQGCVTPEALAELHPLLAVGMGVSSTPAYRAAAARVTAALLCSASAAVCAAVVGELAAPLLDLCQDVEASVRGVSAVIISHLLTSLPPESRPALTQVTPGALTSPPRPLEASIGVSAALPLADPAASMAWAALRRRACVELLELLADEDASVRAAALLSALPAYDARLSRLGRAEGRLALLGALQQCADSVRFAPPDEGGRLFGPSERLTAAGLVATAAAAATATSGASMTPQIHAWTRLVARCSGNVLFLSLRQHDVAPPDSPTAPPDPTPAAARAAQRVLPRDVSFAVAEASPIAVRRAAGVPPAAAAAAPPEGSGGGPASSPAQRSRRVSYQRRVAAAALSSVSASDELPPGAVSHAAAESCLEAWFRCTGSLDAAVRADAASAVAGIAIALLSASTDTRYTSAAARSGAVATLAGPTTSAWARGPTSSSAHAGDGSSTALGDDGVTNRPAPTPSRAQQSREASGFALGDGPRAARSASVDGSGWPVDLVDDPVVGILPALPFSYAPWRGVPRPQPPSQPQAPRYPAALELPNARGTLGSMGSTTGVHWLSAALRELVLPALFSLASDPDAGIRAALCAQLPHVAAALGHTRAARLLAPLLLSFLRDPADAVQACAVDTASLWLPLLCSDDPVLRGHVLSVLVPALFLQWTRPAVALSWRRQLALLAAARLAVLELPLPQVVEACCTMALDGMAHGGRPVRSACVHTLVWLARHAPSHRHRVTIRDFIATQFASARSVWNRVTDLVNATQASGSPVDSAAAAAGGAASLTGGRASSALQVPAAGGGARAGSAAASSSPVPPVRQASSASLLAPVTAASAAASPADLRAVVASLLASKPQASVVASLASSALAGALAPSSSSSSNSGTAAQAPGSAAPPPFLSTPSLQSAQQPMSTLPPVPPGASFPGFALAAVPPSLVTQGVGAVLPADWQRAAAVDACAAACWLFSRATLKAAFIPPLLDAANSDPSLGVRSAALAALPFVRAWLLLPADAATVTALCDAADAAARDKNPRVAAAGKSALEQLRRCDYAVAAAFGGVARAAALGLLAMPPVPFASSSSPATGPPHGVGATAAAALARAQSVASDSGRSSSLMVPQQQRPPKAPGSGSAGIALHAAAAPADGPVEPAGSAGGGAGGGGGGLGVRRRSTGASLLGTAGSSGGIRLSSLSVSSPGSSASVTGGSAAAGGGSGASAGAAATALAGRRGTLPDPAAAAADGAAAAAAALAAKAQAAKAEPAAPLATPQMVSVAAGVAALALVRDSPAGRALLDACVLTAAAQGRARITGTAAASLQQAAAGGDAASAAPSFLPELHVAVAAVATAGPPAAFLHNPFRQCLLQPGAIIPRAAMLAQAFSGGVWSGSSSGDGGGSASGRGNAWASLDELEGLRPAQTAVARMLGGSSSAAPLAPGCISPLVAVLGAALGNASSSSSGGEQQLPQHASWRGLSQLEYLQLLQQQSQQQPPLASQAAAAQSSAATEAVPSLPDTGPQPAPPSLAAQAPAAASSAGPSSAAYSGSSGGSGGWLGDSLLGAVASLSSPVLSPVAASSSSFAASGAGGGAPIVAPEPAPDDSGPRPWHVAACLRSPDVHTLRVSEPGPAALAAWPLRELPPPPAASVPWFARTAAWYPYVLSASRVAYHPLMILCPCPHSATEEVARQLAEAPPRPTAAGGADEECDVVWATLGAQQTPPPPRGSGGGRWRRRGQPARPASD